MQCVWSIITNCVRWTNQMRWHNNYCDILVKSFILCWCYNRINTAKHIDHVQTFYNQTNTPCMSSFPCWCWSQGLGDPLVVHSNTEIGNTHGQILLLYNHLVNNWQNVLQCLSRSPNIFVIDEIKQHTMSCCTLIGFIVLLVKLWSFTACSFKLVLVLIVGDWHGYIIDCSTNVLFCPNQGLLSLVTVRCL